MANWRHCPEVELQPQQSGGLLVFKGTDVPLCRIYEHLGSGGTVRGFADKLGLDAGQAASILEYEAEECRVDLLIRPDGPGDITPISAVSPTGDQIPDWGTCAAVERLAGKVSGAWTFAGSRLPLWAMFSELASGSTIDEFVDWYDADRPKVVAVLEHEAAALRAESPAAYARSS